MTHRRGPPDAHPCLALVFVQTGGITGTPKGLGSSDRKLIGGYLFGPQANLSGADLNGLDLSQAVLTWVRSGGIRGTPSALPAGWKLIAGYLMGSGADLTDANLAGVNLTSVSLNPAETCELDPRKPGHTAGNAIIPSISRLASLHGPPWRLDHCSHQGIAARKQRERVARKSCTQTTGQSSVPESPCVI